MIVVSGCPRSGTSLMMNLLGTLYGEDRIMGKKFPREEREKRNKPKDAAPYVQFLREKRKEQRQRKQERNKEQKESQERSRNHARMMNPNGFYECRYTVQGISYGGKGTGGLKDILENKKAQLVKIVSQGLAKSDPAFIDRVIFMVRNPRAVARSQENLIRPGWNDNGEDNPTMNGKPVRMRSVEMFNTVSNDVARWLKDHPDIPVLLVNYDSLLDDPAAILNKMQVFVGEGGNLEEALAVIDQGLRRSEPADNQGHDWALADATFQKMLNADWQGVIDVRKEAMANKKKDRLFCIRLHKTVLHSQCERCLDHFPTRNNNREQAMSRKSPWKNLPCGYECLVKGKSVEETIENNHWKNEKHIPPVRCKFATVTDELAIPNRSCQGRKVICACDDVALDSLPEIKCNKESCKHYTD